MNVSLFDEKGNPSALAQKVDALTIEATLPELRSLAKFFTKCADEVEKMSYNGPDNQDIILEGDVPDYQMSVQEINVN